MSNYKDIHRTLVANLYSHVAMDMGEVWAARGVGTLPRPDRIGGFEPDLIADGPGGRVIGEAKSNPNMDWPEFITQLRAWHEVSFSPDTAKARLALAVPAGWRAAAVEAAHEAGWADADLTVLEVGIPDGPPAPAGRG